MFQFRFICLALFLVLISVSMPEISSALDSVQVTQAQGYVHHHIWGAPSPTPGYCYWEHSSSETHFHATEEDGYGNMDCPHPWLVHCDADSLSFMGTWPYIDAVFVLGAEYRSELSCHVTITSETLVEASRQVSGDLSTDEHTLIVEFSDGSQQILLADGSGPDMARITLLPGEYVFHLHVNAYDTRFPGSAIQPYLGQVRLQYLEPGSVDIPALTWGTLKASFR